jgi:hypothetical protein
MSWEGEDGGGSRNCDENASQPIFSILERWPGKIGSPGFRERTGDFDGTQACVSVALVREYLERREHQ